jgi:hypothetical protein
MSGVRPRRLILLAVLLLVGCRATARESSWGELTPRTGGMVMPASTPAQPAALTEPLSPVPAAQLQVGQIVITTGQQPLRLYAAPAGDAPVLEEYPPGAHFSIIEPSGIYTGYPVQQEGRQWYRLRATDGLVGWTVVDAVVPTIPTAPTPTPTG